MMSSDAKSERQMTTTKANILPTEDSNLDDTIFQLTSKLPTPPPRPASIGSSSRSSRRSSTASSLARQSRHFDVESADAPPTPSIAGIYAHTGSPTTANHPPMPVRSSPGVPAAVSSSAGAGKSSTQASSYTSLGEEMAAVAAAAASSSSSSDRASLVNGSMDAPLITSLAMEKEQSSSSSGRERRTSRPSAQGSSTSLGRRKPRREGPSIVIGVRSPTPSEPATATPSLLSPTQSSLHSPLLRGADLRPVRPVRLRAPPSPVEQSRVPTSSQAALRVCLAFLGEVVRAWAMLWRQVVLPLVVAAIEALVTLFEKEEAQTEHDEDAQSRRTSAAEQLKPDKTFAERFKLLICSSFLLSTTLSISSYESAKEERGRRTVAESARTVVVQALPSSTPHLRDEASVIADEPEQVRDVVKDTTIRMTGRGKSILHGGVLSVLSLLPLLQDREVWLRSALLISSLVWGLIALFGVKTCTAIHFDVSHSSTGVYRLSSHDEVVRVDVDSQEMDDVQRQRIKDSVCEKVDRLISNCQSFDVECNKALNVIQETELIARGYKITHPLPPISRIESATSSPPRLRNGSLPSARMTQPHSAPAATGSVRGWGQRPSSLIGAANPHETDTMQLMGLRKALSNTLDETTKTLTTISGELAAYVDEEEMALLREMYEVEASPRAQSPSIDNGSGDSSLRRSSWASRQGVAASDTTRPSSSTPTLDDLQSVPGTPLNRGSLLVEGSSLERFGSLRKRESGTWDNSNVSSSTVLPIRPSTRLSYISDKSPLGSGGVTGPNQNGALKRLSYSSSGSITSSVLPYRTSLQPAPRISNQARRQSSIPAALPMYDDVRSASPVGTSSAPSSQAASIVDGLRLMALKASFENMHRQRVKVFCHLLAMDFSLLPTVNVARAASKSTAVYWTSIGDVMERLATKLSELAQKVQRDVQRSIGTPSTLGVDSPRKAKDAHSPLPTTDSAGNVIDYSGFEDRLVGMSEALRSVQIKMRLCANNLSMRSPPALHGNAGDDSVASDVKETKEVTSASSTKSNAAESVFATIRDDLLMLSAEWESALKIMRVQGLTPKTQKSALTNGDRLDDVHAAPTMTLDSPQEAEEDALREWVRSQTSTGDLSTEADVEAKIRQMIERGQAPDMNGANGRANDAIAVEGPDESSDSDKKVEEDLSALLLRSASPNYLPAPGVEKIYEDVAQAKARLTARSALSREERIRLMQHERAENQQREGKRQAGTGVDVQNGMMEELHSVMKNRKSLLEQNGASGTATTAGEARASSSSTSASRPDSQYSLASAAAAAKMRRTSRRVSNDDVGQRRPSQDGEARLASALELNASSNGHGHVNLTSRSKYTSTHLSSGY